MRFKLFLVDDHAYTAASAFHVIKIIIWFSEEGCNLLAMFPEKSPNEHMIWAVSMRVHR